MVESDGWVVVAWWREIGRRTRLGTLDNPQTPLTPPHPLPTSHCHHHPAYRQLELISFGIFTTIVVPTPTTMTLLSWE